MDLILCVNETRIDVYLPVHYNYIVYQNGVIFSLVSTPSKTYHQQRVVSPEHEMNGILFSGIEI